MKKRQIEDPVVYAQKMAKADIEKFITDTIVYYKKCTDDIDNGEMWIEYSLTINKWKTFLRTPINLSKEKRLALLRTVLEVKFIKLKEV
jgi:hypothetical protein